MNTENLNDSIKKKLRRFAQKDHPLFGELELPHQENEFKPDEIVEIEQEAPEEIIYQEDIYLAEIHASTVQAAEILRAEEKKREKVKIRIENIKQQFQNIKDLLK